MGKNPYVVIAGGVGLWRWLEVGLREGVHKRDRDVKDAITRPYLNTPFLLSNSKSAILARWI